MTDVAARVEIVSLEMRAGNHVRPEIAREKRLDPALELRLLAREMHHELAAQYVRVILLEPGDDLRVERLDAVFALVVLQNLPDERT